MQTTAPDGSSAVVIYRHRVAVWGAVLIAGCSLDRYVAFHASLLCVDAGSAQPQVIIFAGLPGTGKSTLAERLARTMRAPAFSGDWLMGGLKPAHAALAKLDRSEYLAAWFGLLRTLVTRQLMLDQSAIVEGVVSDSEFVLWRDTADQFAARLSMIECVCSDEAIHRARIEGRIRGIPGWHEVGWDHVERMRAELPALTVDRLTVDAMEPVEANFRRVLDYIAASPPPSAAK
jgi:predicted kinase